MDIYQQVQGRWNGVKVPRDQEHLVTKVLLLARLERDLEEDSEEKDHLAEVRHLVEDGISME
jgi:hypothetical protein